MVTFLFACISSTYFNLKQIAMREANCEIGWNQWSDENKTELSSNLKSWLQYQSTQFFINCLKVQTDFQSSFSPRLLLADNSQLISDSSQFEWKSFEKQRELLQDILPSTLLFISIEIRIGKKSSLEILLWTNATRTMCFSSAMITSMIIVGHLNADEALWFAFIIWSSVYTTSPLLRKILLLRFLWRQQYPDYRCGCTYLIVPII